MKATEFKTGLKEVKDQLKGIILHLRTKDSRIPFRTLKEFGQAVLTEEAKGMGFIIREVWTAEGEKPVRSFSDLLSILKTEKVQGVSFASRYEAKDFCDYLNNSFGTNV